MLIEQNSQRQPPPIIGNSEEDYEVETQPQHPQKKHLHRTITIEKKKKISSTKKLSDFVDVDVENFSDFDMGLTTKPPVLRIIKKWPLYRNKMKKSMPKVKNIQKMTNEQIVHRVAKWAVETNIVQYILNGNKSFELENWRLVE